MVGVVLTESGDLGCTRAPSSVSEASAGVSRLLEPQHAQTFAKGRRVRFGIMLHSDSCLSILTLDPINPKPNSQ